MHHPIKTRFPQLIFRSIHGAFKVWVSLVLLLFSAVMLHAQRGNPATPAPQPARGNPATPVPQPARGNPATPVPQPARGKVTLGALINEIKEVTQSKRDPATVERSVRERGVDFEATEYIIETLTSVGAWAEIRSLVSKNDTKSAAVAAPPKPAGKLTVACEPVDCRVTVRSSEGTTLSARTQNKSAVFESVPAGSIEIIASADGFRERSLSVQLADQTSVTVSPVVLQQHRQSEVVRLLGRALLFEVYEATKHVDAIEGRGGMFDWRGADGVDHAWSVARFMKRPGEDFSITFETRDGRGSCNVALGPRARTTCQRSLRGYEKDADKAARLFLTFQPYDYVRGLPKDGAEGAEGEARQVSFVAPEGASSKLVLTDEDLLAQVRHQTSEGASLIVEYSHYLNPDQQPGPGRYPMRIQIADQTSKEQWDFQIDGVRRP